MSTPQTQPDLAPCLENLFLFDAKEDAYEIAPVGKIPEWLRGSYYVNGPARFHRGDFRYRHWLDGDGMVCALHFGGSGVRFVNRFVQTQKLMEENEARRPLYRGFGTAFPGDRLRRNVMLQPPANVSVYPFAGTVLAFGEQTLPYQLDPHTLKTVGEFDFGGRLNSLTPFAAHAKFDVGTGGMVNFGTLYAPQNPQVNVYEFDRSANLMARRRFPLPHAFSFHDFGVTPNHYVFYASPLIMDFAAFVQQGRPVYEALRWTPELGSRILVRPRTASAESFEVTAECGYCLHFINCFEEGRRLAVDIIELEKPIYPEYQPVPDLFAGAPLGRPVRYWIDLGSRTLIERIPMPYDRTPDFPSLDPHLFSRPYSTFWMLGISATGIPGRKFFDQLVRASWDATGVVETYQLPRGEYFGGEPVFVPGPQAESGVIIVEHHKAAKSEVDFVIFDAYDLRRGAIARLPLRAPIHPGFHSSFWPVSTL